MRVSNSFVPDKARLNVGPDMGLNYLRWLSAGDKSSEAPEK